MNFEETISIYYSPLSPIKPVFKQFAWNPPTISGGIKIPISANTNSEANLTTDKFSRLWRITGKGSYWEILIFVAVMQMGEKGGVGAPGSMFYICQVYFIIKQSKAIQ